MASPSKSDPTFIPERSDSTRTLVLLFDGTGDRDDADATNVILLRDALLGWPQDTANPKTDKQLVFYQQGIGTYKPRVLGQEFEVPILGPLSQTFDKATGWSLSVHVTYAYQWLVKNYQPGDKISLFGFSRGAYTARALAGMLKAVSLLPADRIDKLEEAYSLYSRKIPKARGRNDPINQKAWLELQDRWDAFKAQNHCTSVKIDFLGCWDTVNSVGIIRPIKLRYTKNNDIVRVFRHALALDEHRVRFKPNLWGQPSESAKDGPRTDAEEVWFAGCHTDVGGGSVLNNVRPNLSHIPLRWMIREIFKCDTGIIFKSAAIRIIGINPSHLHPNILLPRPLPSPPPESSIIPAPTKLTFTQTLRSYNPFSAKKPLPEALWSVPYRPDVTEEEHDLVDCLASAYDQLKLRALLWKPMEYYPMVTEVFQPDAPQSEPVFKEVRKAHKGVGRTVPQREDMNGKGGKIKVHRSVQVRMQAIIDVKRKGDKERGRKYAPRGLVGYGVKKVFVEADPESFEWID